MPAERRVAGCLLLLLAAVPLLWAQLPEHVEAVVGPLAAVLLACVLVLSPTPRWLQGAAWLGAALVLIAADAWSAPMTSWALLVVIPFGLSMLGVPTWAVVLGLLATPGVVAATVGWPEIGQHLAFGWGRPADIIGGLALLGWCGWELTTTFRAYGLRREIVLEAETATALDDAMKRDRGWLEAVAHTVADPSLSGPVRGLGLGQDTLAMAARLDSHTLLLGWIEGEPLATLSVGWALCAAGRAGERDPTALLKLARHNFDEVVAPGDLRWLAVWDRRAKTLRVAGSSNPGSQSRYLLTARGPASLGPKLDLNTEATLTSLHDDSQGLAAIETPRAIGLLLGLVPILAVPALVIAMPLPGLAWLGLVGAMCLGHHLVERDLGLAHAASRESDHQLRERAEIHDDLRFRIAHLHGSLLEYRVAVGEVWVTAHRLRGEVLDGTFADIMLDRRGNAQIVAGEIAGRGIAARFLGLAAQVAARILIDRGRHDAAALPSAVLQQARVFGRTLRYPVRLRLGLVTVRADGCCEASGTLRRLVRVWAGVGQRPADEEAVRITDHVELTEDTRVYLTPAPALPGPEDDAPALDAREATDRVVEALTSGQWHPVLGSLASLFSVVFDGVHAPAHGTIIEVSHSRPAEEDDDVSAPADERVIAHLAHLG